jgi:hypothetical protein
VLGWFWIPNTVFSLELRGFAGGVSGVLGLVSRARMRDVISTTGKGKFFFLCEDRKTQQTQHTQHRVIKVIDFKGIYLCWVCVGLRFFCVGFGFSGGRAMIGEMEVLLKHWAEQCRLNGESGGMGSPMATIMEWGGSAPRGTPGSRIILGSGAGPDAVAQEIGAALSEIGRQDERGDRLMRLAALRYGDDPAPTWLMQMHLLGLESGAKQTYYDQVHSLHVRLLEVLAERADARKWLTAGRGALPQSLLKVASKLRRVG